MHLLNLDEVENRSKNDNFEATDARDEKAVQFDVRLRIRDIYSWAAGWQDEKDSSTARPVGQPLKIPRHRLNKYRDVRSHHLDYEHTLLRLDLNHYIVLQLDSTRLAIICRREPPLLPSLKLRTSIKPPTAPAFQPKPSHNARRIHRGISRHLRLIPHRLQLHNNQNWTWRCK